MMSRFSKISQLVMHSDLSCNIVFEAEMNVIVND